MNEQQILEAIQLSLNKTIKKEVKVDAKTNLADGVLDSLDSFQFFLELEKLTGVEFPDEDLDDFFHTDRIIEFVAENAS